MGNPQSKNPEDSKFYRLKLMRSGELVDSENAGGSPKSTKKSTQGKISLLNPVIGTMIQPIDDQENIPYTSFSIPKPQRQEQAPKVASPQEPPKKKKSDSALVKDTTSILNFFRAF